jgi:hypothetical protein
VAQSAAACLRWFLACGFFYHEYGGDTFFRNVGSQKIYMAPHPKRRHTSSLNGLTIFSLEKSTMHLTHFVNFKNEYRLCSFSFNIEVPVSEN